MSIKQWSYSRVALYEKCAKRAKYKHIDKLPDNSPPSPQAARGTNIHATIEAFVGSKSLEVPVVHVDFIPMYEALREEQPLTEHQVGFTREWEETEFFAANVWGRVVYDVIGYNDAARTVKIVDHKTGRSYPDHGDQLEIYNATALILFPDAVASVAEDWYTDIGPKATLRRSLKREYLQPVIDKWERKIKVMEEDLIFAATPGSHCKWCPFSKSAGGPCIFG